MSTIKHCGFCSLLSRIMRRVTCVGSRRGSSESYYRELGDQDTLKIDGSQASDDSVEINITLPTNGCDHDDEAQQARQVEASADARGRASTSTAHPYEYPEASRAPAQGLIERVQINTPVAVHATVPAAVPLSIAVTTPETTPVAESVAAPSTETIPKTSSKSTPVSETAVAILEAYQSGAMARFRPTGRFLSIHRRRRRRLLTRSLLDQAALLDDLLIGQVQCILDQSAVWSFNAFTLDNVAGGRGLPVLCVHLFQVYNLIAHFRLDPMKVWKLFSMFEENYHSTNPYHNSIHAADVTQAMHCFLQQAQVLEYMEPIEVMSGLLAAIAHDLDHPGVNQPFLVATSNHLVTLYQSKSVLENHHWRLAISCLIESELMDDIPEYRQQLEDSIRSLILATDITRQQDYLGQFKTYLETKTLDLRRADHRHLVLQIALKCADISNPCRPWDISHAWSMKVCEEFFRQGDVERRLNLPLTPLCDRNANTVPKIQSGFFKYVVTPLITEWHRFLQNDLSEQMLRNLVTNHKKWDALDICLQEATKAKEEEGVVDDGLGDETIDIDAGDNGAGDEDRDESANLSGSSEMLLPLPRRSSLNPPPSRPSGFREQLRRFSVPLNVFQDSRFRNKDRGQDIAGALEPEERCVVGTPVRSGRLLQVEQPCEGVLNSEKLIPESTIASITTPQQALRISQMFQEQIWKMDENIPPMEISRTQSLLPRASSHDACIYQRAVKSDSGIRFDARAEDERPQQDNQKTGNQLRENLTAWHRDFSRRRKSMPAETMNETASRERRFRELREVLPQLIARTLSPAQSGRRGSAPVAGAAEPRPPAGRLGSANGSRAARAATHGARAAPEPRPDLPRRSSLPVEVMTGISSC